jgi:Heterokaryon incompatibility protein (HET)
MEHKRMDIYRDFDDEVEVVEAGTFTRPERRATNSLPHSPPHRRPLIRPERARTARSTPPPPLPTPPPSFEHGVLFENFVHHTLPEGCIRLVEVQGYHMPRLIRCRLYVYSIPHCPRYTALSYTWGSPYHNGQYTKNRDAFKKLRSLSYTNERQLLLNGKSLLIGKNLYDFLCTSYDKYTESRSIFKRMPLFWIDQLCINQNDIEEKNRQLQVMHMIYSKARQVMIWLGEAADGSDLAMKYIRGDGSLRAKVLTGFQPDLTIEERNALAALIGRPYWTRLWIVQEILHARGIVVLCGRKSVGWHRFTRLKLWKIRWARIHPSNETLEGFDAIISAKEEWDKVIGKGANAGYDLAEAIQLLSKRECSDSRDRIFGLLSLLRGGNRSWTPLKADYSKSEAEVYGAVLEHVNREKDWPSCRERLNFAWFLQGILGVATSSYEGEVADMTNEFLGHPLGVSISDCYTIPDDYTIYCHYCRTTIQRHSRSFLD